MTQVNTRSKQENFVEKSCSRQLVGKRKRSNRSRMSDSSRGQEMDISSASDDDDEDYEYGGTLKKAGARQKKENA